MTHYDCTWTSSFGLCLWTCFQLGALLEISIQINGAVKQHLLLQPLTSSHLDRLSRSCPQPGSLVLLVFWFGDGTKDYKLLMHLYL